MEREGDEGKEMKTIDKGEKDGRIRKIEGRKEIVERNDGKERKKSLM